MSKVLEAAIREQLPGVTEVHIEGDDAFIQFDGHEAVTRYRLSNEARRIALLEREGRPLDIQPGAVLLLSPDETPD